MAIVRTLSNGNKLVDWTEEVQEIDNQFGLLNGMNIFKSKGTSQESVIFEKEYKSSTLIPQTSRRGKPHSKGRDRQADVFSLALPYFSTEDDITASDLQGQREIGTEAGAKTLAKAIATKMEDMRVNIDQTKEFMQLEAIKGITVDPEGRIIADMFSEFGLTKSDYEVDWQLSETTFDIDDAIRKLKRTLAKNAKQGTGINGFSVLVSPEFFDKVVSHPRIREAYMQYAVVGANSDVVRGNLQSYEQWGVVDHFAHQGVNFLSYDAEFNAPDHPDAVDGVVRGIAANEAHTLATGVRDLYRGYYGPANTLSGANAVGQELFMYQWDDPKDKYITMEAEMSPLYVCMKPPMCIKITAT
jgi:hypothetical protein